MIEQLEALRALKEEGTTARAAVRLRLTQSAISKRIDALEAEVGAPLIEAHGRGCRLTPEGEALVRDASPLLASLRDVIASSRSARATETARLRVAASDSLLSSWLPAVLAAAQARVPGIELELHAHRGPVLVERVRSGDIDLALCVDAVVAADVSVTAMGEEPMVIAPRLGKALGRREREAPVDVWTVEERSLTWAWLERRLRARQPRWGFDLRVVGRVESFAALVQLARAGHCHALVPRGIAVALGMEPQALVALPGLERPIAAVTRKRALRAGRIPAFIQALRAEWPDVFPKRK